jgi:hypothetical protein
MSRWFGPDDQMPPAVRTLADDTLTAEEEERLDARATAIVVLMALLDAGVSEAEAKHRAFRHLPDWRTEDPT